MTKAFYRNAIAFCEAVESFAPSTRKPGRGVVDLRPATLSVKADRLLEALRRAERETSALDVGEVDAFVASITTLLVEWREQKRAPPLDEHTAVRLATLLEQAELVRTLMHSAHVAA